MNDFIGILTNELLKVFPSLQDKLPPLVLTIIVMVVAAGALLALFIAPMAGIFTWIERRVAGRIQHRIGPNRVGPQGLLQFLADGIKLVSKEDIIPDQADKFLFRFAPYVVMSGMFAVLVVVPFSETMVFSDLNVGIVYVLAVASLAPLGIIMAGWSSNNKWSLLGGMRSAAQIVSYELPAALAILSVVLFTGTLSLKGIIEAQYGGFGIVNWFVFRSPFTFLSFFVFFIASLAELNRLPFDIPEAESELVSGYNTEYSGIRFGIFFLSEWANMFVASALIVSLFFGGWVMPGVIYHWLNGIHPLVLNLAQVTIFMAKSMLFVLIIMWLRWTLPRFRVDQLMNFCWKFLTPLAFINLLGVAAWVAIDGAGYVIWQKVFWATKWFMFFLTLALLLRFAVKLCKLVGEMRNTYVDWMVRPPKEEA